MTIEEALNNSIQYLFFIEYKIKMLEQSLMSIASIYIYIISSITLICCLFIYKSSMLKKYFLEGLFLYTQ